MGRLRALAIACLVALAALGAVRGLQRQDRPVTLRAALGEHAASAPLLGGAEAVLANRCLERLGLGPIMPVITQAPVLPFTGATPHGEAPAPGPPPVPTDAQARALFGPPEQPPTSVQDPTGRVLTTSPHGCLSEARAALFGSVRRYLTVAVTQRWLLDRWRIVLDGALSQPTVRDALGEWTACAIARGWAADVQLADVYRIELLPVRTEPDTRSTWKDERYCRVASGVMRALGEALDRTSANDVDRELLRRFVSDLDAARHRAAAVLDP